MDRDYAISNLEQQSRWIEEIECHKFPGWLNVTNAIRDAIALLKEYDTQVQYRDDHIAEYEKEIKRLNKLLKEQESVEPILEQDSMVCGVCGHEVIWQKMIGDGIWVDEELEYCPHCGQAVKWE